MKIFRRLLPQVAVFIILSVLGSVAGAAPGFDSLSFKPDPEQGPYLTVRGARTLGRWRFAGGVTAEFSNDSLQVRNVFGHKIQDLIDDQLVLHAGVALGVTDWLDFGVSAAFVPFQRFQAIGTGRSIDESHVGDVRVESKIRLLNGDHYPVTLSFIPFVTIPTGAESNFVGNGKVTGGGLFTVESPLLWKRLSLAANIGAQFREKVTIDTATTVGHQLLYGAGANVMIVRPVAFVAELSGWAPITGSPSDVNLEANGGFRFFPIPQLGLTVGAGRGLIDGPGTPDYRAFFSLGYRQKARGPKVVKAPEVREEVLRTDQIHFEFNKATIRSESRSVIDRIVGLIQDHPEIWGVRVEGHTDDVGSDTFNRELSERRAGSVREALIENGISSEKTTSQGFGEGTPIADNATREGRAKNRRVEFHFQVPVESHVRIVPTDDSPVYLDDR